VYNVAAVLGHYVMSERSDDRAGMDRAALQGRYPAITRAMTRQTIDLAFLVAGLLSPQGMLIASAQLVTALVAMLFAWVELP
jgi:hypothetical protein